jgi:hypothetical protein
MTIRVSVKVVNAHFNNISVINVAVILRGKKGNKSQNTRKLKIEQHEPYKIGVKSGTPED